VALFCGVALAQEVPVPKAIPVAPPPGPVAVEEPAVTPTPPPEEAPEDDLFTYANLVFSQKQYNLSARQYNKYVEAYPSGKHIEEALYRLGESYLNANEINLAEQAYRNLLTKHSSGDFAGYAAYRIGSLAFTKEKYDAAIAYFKIAEKQAGKADIQTSALYYRARCLQLSKVVSRALPLYIKLSGIREDNPFWQRSVLALGRIYEDRKEPDEALKYYALLVGESGVTPEVRAEALLQSGLIYSDQDKVDLAIGHFEKLIDCESPLEWKSLARYGLIDSLFGQERYKDTIAAYNKTTDYPVPDESRPKMLLMVANSHRYLKQHTKAIDLYIIIEDYYGDHEEGQEAAYSKIICFYNLDDPSLPRFVDAFVRKASFDSRSKGLTDRALLMKAEGLFKIGVFERAAKAYQQIRIDKLPESLRETTLYRRGFAEADGGSPTGAITTFSQFIGSYPESTYLPEALAKRALSYKSLDDASEAIEDFDQIVKNHPGSELVELAYQQSALLKGQRREFAGMVESFLGMLEKFPDSKGAAEATFWVGWGYFEQKEYAKAIPYLEKSRVQDPEEYFDRASLKLVLANFYLQDVNGLKTAIDTYRKRDPKARIPAQILGWIGLKKFEDEDFISSETYLMLASNPDEPRQTRGEIWNYLGKARLRQGRYEKAIPAFDFYLETLEARPAERARVLLDKSSAQLGAGKLDEAYTSAEEGLSLQKDGRVNAQLWIVVGDVELAQKNYEEALKKYIVPSQTFDDPQITPEAISKSADALEKLGKKVKAASLRKELKAKYPNYKRDKK